MPKFKRKCKRITLRPFYHKPIRFEGKIKVTSSQGFKLRPDGGYSVYSGNNTTTIRFL